jgi:predicted nicotinamide N-methyase
MSSLSSPRERELLELVAHTGPLQEDLVTIPGSPKTIRVIRPASIDQLLDQAASDPEQHLPYWSELWPSGIALAALIRRQPDLVRGKQVLELGAGVGITAAMGLACGAELIATDYAPESLILTQLTCLRYCGREPRTARVNWRDPAEPLLDGSVLFPVVLAADVLYERRDIGPLLDLMERIVAPGGMFVLAEPGRNPARTFLEQATERGWRGDHSSFPGPWPDPKDEGVVVRIQKQWKNYSASHKAPWHAQFKHTDCHVLPSWHVVGRFGNPSSEVPAKGVVL